MHWYDWVCAGVLLAGGVVQAIRASRAEGWSLTMFEAFGAIAGAVAATQLAGPLGLALHFERWIVMIILFVLFSVGAFLVARWLFSVLSWSFGSLDGFFGFVFGLALAWAVANITMRVIIELNGGASGAVGAIVLGPEEARRTAPIANEIMNFRTWNSIMNLLFKVKMGPEFNPDVG